MLPFLAQNAEWTFSYWFQIILQLLARRVLPLRFDPTSDHLRPTLNLKASSAEDPNFYSNILSNYRQNVLQSFSFLLVLAYIWKELSLIFEIIWANPGVFFVYFRPFLTTISIIQIEKCIDGVLGIRTRGCRMVSADKNHRAMTAARNNLHLQVRLELYLLAVLNLYVRRTS